MSPKQKKLQVGEVEQRGSEIKHKKSCEKDWPNKHHMDGYVYSVAMISTIESKVLFKVKQSLSHWGMRKLFFSGKVSDFLASFPEKKNWALFGFVCGKEGFENWMKRFCELLEKRTTNYRGFKDRTEAMEKASFCLRE